MALSILLARKDIKARIMQRRNSYMVYLKSGTRHPRVPGARRALIKARSAMENARVIKSVRNDVNRQHQRRDRQPG